MCWRILYFSTVHSDNRLRIVLSVKKKSLKVVNNTPTIGLWRSLTCKNSHDDISPLTLWKSDKIILWGIFEKLKILVRDFFETSQRRHRKDIFFEICSRCLKNVTQKTSFSRCFWDVLKTSQKDIFLEMYLKRLKEKSHLLWDVSKKFLRCLSQWRSDWDLSETSHAGWGVTIW